MDTEFNFSLGFVEKIYTFFILYLESYSCKSNLNKLTVSKCYKLVSSNYFNCSNKDIINLAVNKTTRVIRQRQNF